MVSVRIGQTVTSDAKASRLRVEGQDRFATVIKKGSITHVRWDILPLMVRLGGGGGGVPNDVRR